MQNEADIRTQITTLQAAYHEVADTLSMKEVRERTAEIQGLRAKLSEMISKGAKHCPECETMPHGMQKNPSTYEIGCLSCPLFARGGTREEAVEAWNALRTARVREPANN